MDINVYIQGEEGSGAVFGLLGPILTDAAVHAELGMAITSREGDTWVIAQESGSLVGFALVRPLASGKAWHVRFLHALRAAGQTKSDILQFVLNRAKEGGIQRISTNDRAENKVWSRLGFVEKPGSRRTNFTRFEWISGGKKK